MLATERLAGNDGPKSWINRQRSLADRFSSRAHGCDVTRAHTAQGDRPEWVSPMLWLASLGKGIRKLLCRRRAEPQVREQLRVIRGFLGRLQSRRNRGVSVASWTEEKAACRFHQMQQLRLRVERMGAQVLAQHRSLRVISTACWEFPVYSQTFVYQELAELARKGFQLRFLYSKLNPRNHLPPQFSRLWSLKRKLVLHPTVCERDYAYYCRRMPGRVEALVDRICAVSGLSPAELRNHYHFKQGFAFTRTVEACRPDYLHSYFFYEGTLFTLIASYLLGIPRGVSCYSDHMLDDYALKVVPLHLGQCSLVIATSARIKRELIAIAPNADPDRILVKPNAVDCSRFPVANRTEPADGRPFRIVCVSRIEPKKGIIYLGEAIRRLIDSGLNVSLYILGGVDNNDLCRQYAREVEMRISELGVAHAIRLEGRLSGPQIGQFLRDAHLFVAPFVETEGGDKDGIPTALLEAMASGLPSVATDAGSITEVIEDGKDGVIVPQRDAEALSGAIRAILGQPERRLRMGQEAAAKIRRSFDIRVCERTFHERIRTVVAAADIVIERKVK